MDERTRHFIGAGNIGDGPRRIFPILPVYAQAYTTILLSAEIDFSVVWGRGRVDIITPYKLNPNLFPKLNWVVGDDETTAPKPVQPRLINNPFGDDYELADH